MVYYVTSAPQPPGPIHARHVDLAAVSKSPLGSRAGISGCKCVLLPDLLSSVTECHSCRSSDQILGYLPCLLPFSPTHIQSCQLYLRDILKTPPGLTLHASRTTVVASYWFPGAPLPLYLHGLDLSWPHSEQHLSQVPSSLGSKLSSPSGFSEEETRPPSGPQASHNALPTHAQGVSAGFPRQGCL